MQARANETSDQLALELSRRAGEEAMAACAAKADRVNPPGWVDLAFAYFVKWCSKQKRGTVMLPEAVAIEYGEDANFVQPHDDRAWGQVVKRAIAVGVITYHDSEGRRIRGHGARCARYKTTGKRPTEVML